MLNVNIQLFGGRGSGSGMTGGVTKTSIPSLTQDNLQKFVDQFGTGISVSEMVKKVYYALPVKGTGTGVGGRVSDVGASIVNDKYLEVDGGPTYQFIRQKSKGTWKVKPIG